MTVLVRLPQALLPDAGGSAVLPVDLPADATLADLLEAVGHAHPALVRRICDETGAVRRFVNVFVGDEECRRLQGLHTPVPDGTEVLVVGSVAGG